MDVIRPKLRIARMNMVEWPSGQVPFEKFNNYIFNYRTRSRRAPILQEQHQIHPTIRGGGRSICGCLSYKWGRHY